MSIPRQSYSRQKIASRPRSMSVTHDFECRLFDSPYRSVYNDDDNIGYSSYTSYSSYNSYGYEPFPVLVMAKQQGFVFNEELLVSPVRRRSGYETLASMSKSSSSSEFDENSSRSSQDELDKFVDDDNESASFRASAAKGVGLEQQTEGVVEIKLQERDCDIWPE
ncbi:hypothetical protein INT43_003386 [Umbelopsis isabellina]|uniref:Uncharacterized protein n=1 Tax=Mortierella isabellina TaxID=91625 RepID=A0A8H7UFN0_MORIS|nr:hypothetical protein INT43_003386 [Umbelopsis isabellina]